MANQKQVLHVVMVDDEVPLSLAVRRILAKYLVSVADVGVDVTYATTHFANGEAFLESLEQGAEYDLLLLDLKLPGMSGLDILAELGRQERSIVTMMITAYATFDTAVQATKLGAFDFIAKPFSPEEFRYAIQKATEQLIVSREARRLAEEQRQVRFNFISVLSHELKAPLNAIEGYLKILQDDEPPERRQMIDRSLLRLDGMRKLIFDLLDLTRIESGQKARQFATVDVRTIAQRTIDLFINEATDRKIGITLRAAQPVEMSADPSEIEIVLNNLVSNAVKYNRDGGSVTVALERKDDEVKIQVSDTGIGMTPEESAKLFNEFVRIKNEDTYKILGSGLGLSTVRKLAQMYGGDATVKSEKGVGSIFTVTLRDAAPETAVSLEPPADALTVAAAPDASAAK
ncbi:MAG: response regulator [Thermoleophilia bacterium]|nr:response regulator [Thermoleophilia bacterium]